VRFGEDHIIDIGHLDPGSPDRFLQHGGREHFGGSVDQRALERCPDRGPDCTDDDGLGHVVNLRFGCANGQHGLMVIREDVEAPIVSATVATTI
jgi:hypothetical protein